MSTPANQRPPPIRRDRDLYTWALETAGAIRARRLMDIDWLAVAEELQDMGQNERRALEHGIELLLAHLIEWSFHPSHRSHLCTGTIKEQRRRAARLLRQSPGLRQQLAGLIPDAYEVAKGIAEQNTGLDDRRFPPSCPWTAEQILDERFLPPVARGPALTRRI